MTVEEIRENAKPKHECECGELKKQISELKGENAKSTLKFQLLQSEYDNLMEMCDELTDENENLKGQIKGLKYAIKRLTKNEI